MAIKLGDLQKRTKVVQVEYQGEVVNVEYRVNAVTPAFVASDLSPVEQVREVVADWDILDEAGAHIAPAEIVEQLPIGLLVAVVEAIVGDMRLGDAEKKG